MADQTYVGALGTVIRDVRGGRMPGEIRVLDGGEPVLLLAFCAEPLAPGTRVRVVASRGSRQVDVVSVY